MAYAELVPAGFERSQVATRHAVVSYWIRPGIGRTVLFVHGNSASKCAFRDLLRSVELRDQPLIAVDLPGCGESGDAPDVQYTIPMFARTLRELVHRLALVKPMVVGWSLGGHAVIELIGQDPDLLHAAVLTGTPPCGPGAAEVLASFRPSDLMAVTTGENPPSELLDAYVRALYGHTREIDPELYLAARRCHGRMRRVFSEHWLAGGEGHAQRSVIARWHRPLAVIQGDQEPFFDPAILEHLAWNNLWRGRSQSVSDTGHAPFYERPSAYADLLAQLLHDVQ